MSFWISVALCLWASAFFALVVVAIPFLTSQDFWPDPLRLMGDAATSIALEILSFALLYLQLGIVNNGEIHHQALDAVYFSAVTFSTLGYGDFAPSTIARIPAAFQAILGNLHLGMIVGVIFFAMQRKDH